MNEEYCESFSSKALEVKLCDRSITAYSRNGDVLESIPWSEMESASWICLRSTDGKRIPVSSFSQNDNRNLLRAVSARWRSANPKHWLANEKSKLRLHRWIFVYIVPFFFIGMWLLSMAMLRGDDQSTVKREEVVRFNRTMRVYVLFLVPLNVGVYFFGSRRRYRKAVASIQQQDEPERELVKAGPQCSACELRGKYMKMSIDDIVVTIGRNVKTWQIYCMIGFALLGAILAIAGLIQGYDKIDKDLEALPDYATTLGIGVISFCLFFPFGYVMLLMKEMAKLRREMESLKKLCEK